MGWTIGGLGWAVGDPTPPPPPPQMGILAGPLDGSFPGGDVSFFTRFETWLGHDMQWAMSVMDDSSMAAGESSVWAFATGDIGSGGFSVDGNYGTISGRINATLAVPLGFGGAGPTHAYGPTLTQAQDELDAVTAGTYDAAYTYALGQMVTGGFGAAVLRVGWEMDGNWYPWSCLPGAESNYIAAFQYVHDLALGISADFLFDWCGDPSLFQDLVDRGGYPGDAYVDIIGLDAYENSVGIGFGFTPLASYLAYQLSFAEAHGKLVSYPEWGTGTNNASYINGMADWLASLPASGPGALAYQTYFNQNNGTEFKVFPAALQPVASAAYLARFGIGSPPPPPSSPVITSIAPNTGDVAGGDLVTIRGSSFTGATAVAFGATAAASFAVGDDTTITATTDAETAATVHTRVTNAAGTSAAVAADRFTFTSSTIEDMLMALKLINYYPKDAGWLLMWSSFPRAEMQADFAAMAAIGANAVRIIVQTEGVGYPTPRSGDLGKLATIIADAWAAGLQTQLTLFDFFGGYTEFDRSTTWVNAVLGPYTDDPRIAFVEIKNEMDGTAAVQMTWAQRMYPIIKGLAGNLPITVSIPGNAPAGSLAAIVAALPNLDFYDVHDYGSATALLAGYQSLVAPKPLYIGEAGKTTGNGGSPSDPTLETAQVSFFTNLYSTTHALGLPLASPWAWTDFVDGSLTWTGPTSSEYHYGLYRVDGSAKPALAVVTSQFAAGP